MKEIIELNRRIIAEAPEAVRKEFGFLMVCRGEDNSAVVSKLPVGIKGELEELCRKLDAAIPDDFEYQIVLGDDRADVLVVYNDGVQTQANCPMEWDEKRSIFDQLKEVDWGTERAEVLARCQSIDVLKEEAKDRPATLPSTKQLQKAFRSKMKAFVREKREDASRVHVMMYREDNGLNPECGLKEETYGTVEEFARDLYNIMTVQYWVIAVVADGKPLPVMKIDALKKQALKELEGMPISLMKALGKL